MGPGRGRRVGRPVRLTQKLIERAAFGWPESAAPLQATTRGVKIHYEGTAASTSLLDDRDACTRRWRSIRESHLANPTEHSIPTARRTPAKGSP